jgi:hypothetical protein
MARTTDSIAADVAALQARLRTVSAAVDALIGGATGHEDRRMTEQLGAAGGRSQQAARTLNQAAQLVRRLGTPR